MITQIEIGSMLTRLAVGAGRPCLFLPFVGEFGHEVMTHIRLVHFHQASEKVVCCRPGHEVLYPSATSFVIDWQDPVNDLHRIATMRHKAIAWPVIIDQYPNHQVIAAGGLTREQELYCIEPAVRIPFRPRVRNLKVDVVLGVRQRQFAPIRNWTHWKAVANGLRDAGLTFAVMGNRATSFDLDGQSLHTGDYDTDLAIELLKSCKLYVGTDSGGSHLASTIGASMLVFRETASGSRDLTPRMREVNGRCITALSNAWDRPATIIDKMLKMVDRGRL
jgi:hypothetical protein